MTPATAPATALLGLALALGTAPASFPDPPSPQAAAAAAAPNAWLASYQRDTTRAVTTTAVAASRVARAQVVTAHGSARASGRARASVAAGAAAGAAARAPRLGISCGARSWPIGVRSRITSLFGVTQIGGYRAGGGDHSAGLALDVMVGRNKALGNRVARWSQVNAKALNIKYVIWYQRIWFPGRSASQWRAMGDRGGATANHIDHVHLSFNRGKGKCG